MCLLSKWVLDEFGLHGKLWKRNFLGFVLLNL